MQYLRNGHADLALSAFESAYRLDPMNSETINNVGYAHLYRNDPQAAARWLLLALVLEPGRANAWTNLGESYAKQGRDSEAQACLVLAKRFSGTAGP